MPFAEHFMVSGTFTVPATVTTSVSATVNVNCGFQPTKVVLNDVTALAAMAGGPPVINPGATYLGYQWDWNSGFGNGTALSTAMAPAASVTNVPVVSNGWVAVNGITPYNGGGASPNQLSFGAPIAGSSVTKASGTFTVTSTATLYVGARVLLTGFTVDKQLGGMMVTIATIPNSTTFTIANSSTWLNTASFTGGAQVFAVRLVTVPALYYPESAQIAFVSQANSAVVTTTTNTSLTVGQQVRVLVPSRFGMTQANNQTAIISAVSGNQVTLGGLVSLNSSAFTAFSWPTAAQVPFTPAYLVPIGSGPSPQPGPPITYNVDVLDDATTSQAYQGFQVGSNILIGASSTVLGVTAGDTIVWTAWRGDV